MPRCIPDPPIHPPIHPFPVEDDPVVVTDDEENTMPDPADEGDDYSVDDLILGDQPLGDDDCCSDGGGG